MNVRMWLHKATQRNYKILQDYGYNLLDLKKVKWLVVNLVKGKMSSPRQILAYLKIIFIKKI